IVASQRYGPTRDSFMSASTVPPTRPTTNAPAVYATVLKNASGRLLDSVFAIMSGRKNTCWTWRPSMNRTASSRSTPSAPYWTIRTRWARLRGDSFFLRGVSTVVAVIPTSFVRLAAHARGWAASTSSSLGGVDPEPLLVDRVVRAVGLGRLQRVIHDREQRGVCLLYTSPSPRDGLLSRMPS